MALTQDVTIDIVQNVDLLDMQQEVTLIDLELTDLELIDLPLTDLEVQVLTEVEEIQEVTIEIPIDIEIEQTSTVVTTQTAPGS